MADVPYQAYRDAEVAREKAAAEVIVKQAAARATDSGPPLPLVRDGGYYDNSVVDEPSLGRNLSHHFDPDCAVAAHEQRTKNPPQVRGRAR
jgi:hypothetical protein